MDVLSVVERKAHLFTEPADEKVQLREQREEALAEIEELAIEFDHAVTTKLAEGKPTV